MKNRDDFTDDTKRRLAARVGGVCSFPGCSTYTMGPGSKTPGSVTTLGEAAHIHAAAKGGPRYDPDMTPEERRSIANGIWLCRHHARLVDADHVKYSAATITQWKQLAEKAAYDRLKLPGRGSMSVPTTLVQIGRDLVFEGYWRRAEAAIWDFDVVSYLYGDEVRLRDYCSDFSHSQAWNRFVVIESQGDGRLTTADPSWTTEDGGVRLKVPIGERPPAMDPDQLGGDLSFDMEVGDLVVENGDFAVVRGVEAAIQHLSCVLSSEYRKTPYGYGRIRRIRDSHLFEGVSGSFGCLATPSQHG